MIFHRESVHDTMLEMTELKTILLYDVLRGGVSVERGQA